MNAQLFSGGKHVANKQVVLHPGASALADVKWKWKWSEFRYSLLL
jgi:hypothetical protein